MGRPLQQPTNPWIRLPLLPGKVDKDRLFSQVVPTGRISIPHFPSGQWSYKFPIGPNTYITEGSCKPDNFFTITHLFFGNFWRSCRCGFQIYDNTRRQECISRVKSVICLLRRLTCAFGVVSYLGQCRLLPYFDVPLMSSLGTPSFSQASLFQWLLSGTARN